MHCHQPSPVALLLLHRRWSVTENMRSMSNLRSMTILVLLLRLLVKESRRRVSRSDAVSCWISSWSFRCSLWRPLLSLIMHVNDLWKDKYTPLLAILIVGSFINLMAQYFWYVRDDNSSDRFIGQNVPEPEEPPKKKGWFQLHSLYVTNTNRFSVGPGSPSSN
jgi:hypothetical protein